MTTASTLPTAMDNLLSPELLPTLRPPNDFSLNDQPPSTAAARRCPLMMSSQSNSRRVDKGHGCFFSEQFASDSFCAHLDPDFEHTYGFNETDIADLIRAGRPDLFAELGRLPLSSTDTIGSGSVLHCSSSGHQSRIPILCEALAAATRDKLSEFRQIPSNRERRMLELQHKRHVQLSLLNGCDLTLQKLVDSSMTVSCACPGYACSDSKIPQGTYFLSLWKERHGYSGCVVKRFENHYSLTCLEDLFNRGLTLSTDCDLDGQLDHRADTGFPFQYPSNSAEARRLREERYREIEDTLREDQLRSSRKMKPGDGHGTERPSLKLHRASNISPFVSRYRKEGLRWGEQKRKSKELENPFTAASELQKAHPDHGNLICSCREPAGESELVKCSSNGCMIGTFHLQCLGLDEPLEEGDEVYCMYCAENFVLDKGCGSEDCRSDASTFMEGYQQLEPESELPNTCKGFEENTDRSDFTTVESDGENFLPFERHHFQAINTLKSGTGIFHTVQTDGARSLPPLTRYLKPVKPGRGKTPAQIPLQPGSSQMAFTDLAPFISLAYSAYSPTGLNKKEVKAFQDWKCSCPNSGLLQAIPLKERAKRGLNGSQKGRVVTGGRHVVAGSMGRTPLNLSEVLNCACTRGT